MSDFQSFAMAHGLLINQLHPADKVQRCPTVDKPRSKNGAWFWDGFKGWVSDWAQGGDIHWFDNPQAKTWTDSDRRAWAQRKQAAQARQSDGWVRAARQAEQMLQDTELKNHDYLQLKGLKDSLGLVTEQNDLLVPMRNSQTNALQGVQIIRWLPNEMRYEKKMLPGMRAKGTALRLGPKTATETFLCEGYATGLSIDLAARLMRLNAAVLICFSDSNMVHVASTLQGRAFVCADNDESNAGLRAAEKTNLPYCMSPVLGEDFNDFHARAGLMAAAQLLMKVRMT
jgi:putative DNA primase/helicase